MRSYSIFGIIVAAALALLCYMLRPLGIIRGTYMVFYKYPALFWIPLALFIIIAVLYLISTAGEEPEMGLGAGAVVGAVAFLILMFFVGGWQQVNIARHAGYGKLDIKTLQGGEVRVKPHAVAAKQLQNSFNSPTEQVTNMHVVEIDGKLVWSAVRDPDGTFRKYTKPTTGLITSGAETTAPDVKVHDKTLDANFKYGPGMHISQNIKWQLYKKGCYNCDIEEMVALPTADGPVIMVPYVKYVGGFFSLTRRPTFGGVYIVHADGKIDKLNAKQAAANEMVRKSGRMFPEKLARQTADAYKYKLGLANRMFTHKEGYEVSDVGENKQPYLQQFKGQPNAQWVTTFKPRGRAGSTGMIMTTDAVSGKTLVWKAPQDKSYIGNARSIDIVKGERLNVNFAGAFDAIEPRQVFPGGKLHFLVSVVPAQANRVTLSVIVDAESQTVVKVFPATPQGDTDLIAYLNNEEISDEYDFNGTTPGDVATPDGGNGQTTSPTAPTGKVPTGKDTVSTIERLLEQNREQQAGLALQEKDLVRILATAKKLAKDEPAATTPDEATATTPDEAKVTTPKATTPKVKVPVTTP